MIETVAPLGFILLCIALAAILTWVLYRKNNFEPKWKKYTLYGLRFSGLFLVFLLLLSPFFKLKSNRTEAPFLLVGLDQSTSITENDKKIIAQQKDQLKQLEDKYQVKFCKIADRTTVFEDTGLNKSKTNLGSFFDFANEAFEGRNIGAMVLLSDGINNQGANPLFKKLNKQSPVYAVGFGDTTQYPDIQVLSVLGNETVFFDNEFSIQTSLKARAIGNKTITAVLLEDGKPIQNRQWNPASENAFTELEFVVKAAKTGTHRYTVQVQAELKEKNLANNARSVVVNVTDTRRKIVLIYDAPNPDIAAINRALEKVTHYSLAVKPASADIEVSATDIFILHNIPSSPAHVALLNKIGTAKKPVVFITGTRTQWGLLNQWNKTFSFNVSDESLVESQAVWNSNFSEFSLSQEMVSSISKLPPLKLKYGNFQGLASLKILFSQKLGAVATPFPLIGFSQKEKVRYGWIFGEGLWRWRMKDYQLNGSSEFTDELVQRMVQYITTEEIRQALKIYTEKPDYEYGDKIVIVGEKFDNDGELNNTEACNVTIVSENGTRLNLAMGKHGRSYRLDAGTLPSGNYEVTAITSGETKQTARTRFSVGAYSSELSETTANHNLLRVLSANSGGRFYDKNEFEKLITELKNKEVSATIYTEQKITDMIDIKWFFALIVLLFTLEWFIRRREGAY